MVAVCVVAPAGRLQSVNGQRSILIHDRFPAAVQPGRAAEVAGAPAESKSKRPGHHRVRLEGRRVGFEVHRIRRRTVSC